MGGEPTFDEATVNGEVAPIPDLCQMCSAACWKTGKLRYSI
jgi:hypothetical protein